MREGFWTSSRRIGKVGSTWNGMGKGGLSLSWTALVCYAFCSEGERNGWYPTATPGCLSSRYSSCLLCCENQEPTTARLLTADIRFTSPSTHATRNKKRVKDGVPKRQMIGFNPSKRMTLKSNLLPSAPTTQPACGVLEGLYGDPRYATPAPHTPVPSTHSREQI